MTASQDYEGLRRQMVQHQLRSRSITDERVLEAMQTVPREEFVPASLRDRAYEDGALPIGEGQTISQPYTVAFMCEALKLEGDEKVLEVGAGSGYAACVLGLLAREVYSVERIPRLVEEASQRVKRLGYPNVHIQLINGTLGLPEEAPFDGIIVTAGGKTLPRAYVEQLKPGGRIVIPLGETPNRQSMYRFSWRDGELEMEDLGSFAFVPLVGEQGWKEEELER